MDDFIIKDEAEKCLRSFLARRAYGEPLQYIEGFQDFMGIRLKTDARALIPRQDTETLAEASIAVIDSFSKPEVLDLCTGSGALALAIKKMVPRAKVTATDISEAALSLSLENASSLGLEIEFLRGDLFSAVEGRQFDVIVSNPPYLSGADMDALQREVQFEPRDALFGGMDGLSFYRRIGEALEGVLKPEGTAFFEVGAGQAPVVADIFLRALPGALIIFIKDLLEIDRVVVVKKGAPACS